MPTQDGRQVIMIVGLGMVGCAFIEKMLDRDTAGQYKLVTCSEEPYHPYNRVGLTEYFEHRSVDKLFLQPPEWFAKHNPEHFSYYLGEAVARIEVDAKQVITSKDRVIEYDFCVFSTGSASTLPPYISQERAEAMDGIFVYRNIADLNSILSYGEKPEVNHASVVGGGLLGLEAAKAVYDMEPISKVSILNRSSYPLSRQLDDDAGELVLRRIEAMGVNCLTNVNPSNIITTTSEAGREKFAGFELADGTVLDADLVIFAIGISPRDEIAKACGINVHTRGGIIVDDNLETSSKGVFAIGECCNWRGNTYGLIGPGVEMADILSFNLTQLSTSIGTHKARKMNPPDLSTKLKLMGVDVASFGDFFADREAARASRQETENRRIQASNSSTDPKAGVNFSFGSEKPSAVANKKRLNAEARAQEPVMAVTYKDPFDSVYKKYIFSADGQYLLGGMMVGDVGDYVKLVSVIKKKKKLDQAPSQFIVGSKKSGDEAGDDLDDDAQICSCHNVLKADIAKAVQSGVTMLGDIKSKTKAGTGCGGCMPLVTSLYKSEMKRSGKAVNNDLCPHFAMPRSELFKVIKVKRLESWPTVLEECGTSADAVGCEICKPTVASILSSLYNQHVMDPRRNGLQDTNDRVMANIQRNGTYSVVPRVPAGEIKPEHLIVIGEIARDYGLYTKVTGGQRIDMFGAQKEDLPDIWERLIKAGMESGQAYGKSLRTVKSCVGTTWCRFGVGDSVGLAVQLENRYKGIRSPHKIKGGVSGCVRECAEAQNKDFGLIATDKGWNIFIAGNGGAQPVHSQLFAKDVPPNKVVTILDRYLMFYIQTADKLQRTARWLESFEGGIERLRKIVLDDALGICAELDASMAKLVDTFECEWTKVVEKPESRQQFKKFANAARNGPESEYVEERGQKRPADWASAYPPAHLASSHFPTPKEKWEWKTVAKWADLTPSDEAQTSIAVLYGQSQLAVFHVPSRGLFSSQQMCPHKRAFVLDHGLIGEGKGGAPYVSCPLHKRNYNLNGQDRGSCSDENYSILTFDARRDVSTDDISLLLPPEDELDAVLATEKWIVRQATSEALGRGSAGQVRLVAPNAADARKRSAAAGEVSDLASHTTEEVQTSCGSGKLSW